jgi:hypothetical protein
MVENPPRRHKDKKDSAYRQEKLGEYLEEKEVTLSSLSWR